MRRASAMAMRLGRMAVVSAATVVLAVSVASGTVMPPGPTVSDAADRPLPRPGPLHDHDDLMSKLLDIERELGDVDRRLSSIELDLDLGVASGDLAAIDRDLATICRALDTFC